MNSLRKKLFTNYILIIVIISIILLSLFLVGSRNFYYNNAYTNLVNKLESINNFYSDYFNTNYFNINQISKMILNNFQGEDVAELEVYDLKGEFIDSNTGYQFSQQVRLDVNEDLEQNIFTNAQTQEKIMCVTTKINNSQGETIGFLRILTSLEKIDEILWRYFLFALLTIVVIITVLSVLSLVFTESILDPIDEIIKVSKELGDGNFDSRIKNSYENELGVLANSINYMADEIQKSRELQHEFISSISHEIRTPLTSIEGWGETILTSDLEDEATIKKGINIIIKESNRLSSMVEELLDFSKIESGDYSLEKEQFNLIDLIKEVVSLYEVKTKNKNIEIIFKHPEQSVIINGDKNKLRQVIINILENSYKFSPIDSKIDILLHEKPHQIKLSIIDYGQGIKKQELPKVKEKFYKGKSKKPGSGLGLTISDNIIQMHGGQLIIESEYHKNTEVIIVLPKNKEELDVT